MLQCPMNLLQELRQMEHIQNPGMNHRQSTFRPAIGESAQLKSELILLKRKLNRLSEKEKRIQVKNSGHNLFALSSRQGY